MNAQERTKPELLNSLRQVLIEALEFNREEARRVPPKASIWKSR